MVDCQSLRAGIRKLEEQCETLRQQINHINEAGKGLSQLVSAKQDVGAEANTVVAKYLADFISHNPELFPVEVFPNEPPIVPLSRASLDDAEKHKWQDLGADIKKMRLLTSSGSEVTVTDAAKLPDGSVLLGGSRGALYHYHEGQPENGGLGKRIRAFEPKKNGHGKDGMAADIYCLLALPDGEVLIGSSEGLYPCRQREGKWELQDEIRSSAHVPWLLKRIHAQRMYLSTGSLALVEDRNERYYDLQFPGIDALFQNLDQIIAKAQ